MLLPEPLRPTMPKNSPWRISKETSSRARRIAVVAGGERPHRPLLERIDAVGRDPEGLLQAAGLDRDRRASGPILGGCGCCRLFGCHAWPGLNPGAGPRGSRGSCRMARRRRIPGARSAPRPPLRRRRRAGIRARLLRRRRPSRESPALRVRPGRRRPRSPTMTAPTATATGHGGRVPRRAIADPAVDQRQGRAQQQQGGDDHVAADRARVFARLPGDRRPDVALVGDREEHHDRGRDRGDRQRPRRRGRPPDPEREAGGERGRGRGRGTASRARARRFPRAAGRARRRRSPAARRRSRRRGSRSVRPSGRGSGRPGPGSPSRGRRRRRSSRRGGRGSRSPAGPRSGSGTRPSRC